MQISRFLAFQTEVAHICLCLVRIEMPELMYLEVILEPLPLKPRSKSVVLVKHENRFTKKTLLSLLLQGCLSTAWFQ